VNAHRLYTPEVLAAAVSLASHPLTGAMSLRGEARSASCGSRIELGLALDDAGRIERIGLSSRACAIGQASAAVFAGGAKGLGEAQIREAAARMRAWIAGDDDMPDWPGIELIAPAHAYPGRHGAMLLPWRAACAAFDG